MAIILWFLIDNFNFWILYFVFNCALEISLIAWTLNVFSLRGHQWNSKWFSLIFQIPFIYFIIALKSFPSLKVWFIFLLLNLIDIHILIGMLSKMIYEISLILWILVEWKLLSRQKTSGEHSIHVYSKIVFLEMLKMKVIALLLL